MLYKYKIKNELIYFYVLYFKNFINFIFLIIRVLVEYTLVLEGRSIDHIYIIDYSYILG